MLNAHANSFRYFDNLYFLNDANHKMYIFQRLYKQANIWIYNILKLLRHINSRSRSQVIVNRIFRNTTQIQ